MQGRQEELLTAAVPALAADVLRHHGWLKLRAHGCSMFPVIRSGDVLSVRRCTTEAIDPGDVVLIADGSRLFAHRLIEKRLDQGEWILITRGDAHWRRDPPRPASTLLGLVIGVSRNGVERRPPFSATAADRFYGVAASESRWLVRAARALVRRIPYGDAVRRA